MTGREKDYCELFDYDCSFSMSETCEWLADARDSIIWHIDTKNILYIEAIDGGEKTFSVYGQKKINGQQYWFEFDGLRYLIDSTLLRLTQTDCLIAILIFESMRKIDT